MGQERECFWCTPEMRSVPRDMGNVTVTGLASTSITTMARDLAQGIAGVTLPSGILNITNIGEVGEGFAPGSTARGKPTGGNGGRGGPANG